MIADLYLKMFLSFLVCQPKKKSRHELEEEKKAAEKALVQRETQLMDPSLRPEDAAAFERLLLASPNSSLLWLQYMAHHLQATQIEQARAVAERALKTISFRWVIVWEKQKWNIYFTATTRKFETESKNNIRASAKSWKFGKCSNTILEKCLFSIYTITDVNKKCFNILSTIPS